MVILRFYLVVNCLLVAGYISASGAAQVNHKNLDKQKLSATLASYGCALAEAQALVEESISVVEGTPHHSFILTQDHSLIARALWQVQQARLQQNNESKKLLPLKTLLQAALSSDIYLKKPKNIAVDYALPTIRFLDDEFRLVVSLALTNPFLSTLFLFHTKLSANGLVTLAQIAHLQELTIKEETPEQGNLNDFSMQVLGNHPHLEILIIWNNKITAAGINI